MNLIRKYKISKITNAPITGVEGEIINFIKSWISDLKPFKIDKKDEDKFLKVDATYFINKKDEVVLTHIDETLYVRDSFLWEVLQDEYNLSPPDTSTILKIMVKDIVSHNFEKMKYCSWSQNISVEEIYKKEKYGKSNI